MRLRTYNVSPVLLTAALALAGAAQLVRMVWSGAGADIELAIDVVVLIALFGAGLLAVLLLGAARRTDEALRRSEARHRSIVDGAGEAIIVIDDQAVVASFNRAAERMFGFSADDMIGTSLERLMPDHVRRAHAQHLMVHGVTGMVEADRMRSVHKGLRRSGEVFPFELTMTEWIDDGRRMFTGVMRDVTERERAQAALRESEARYAGLYENSTEPFFIYAVGKAGAFRFNAMNRAAEALLGVDEADLAEGGLEALSPRDGAKQLKRALLRCLEEGARTTVQLELTLPGGPRTLDLTIFPLRESSGEITRLLATTPAAPVSEQRARPAA